MKSNNKRSKAVSTILASAIFVTSLTPAMVFGASEKETVELNILATSDIHGKIYPWEYATDLPQEWGLAKIATLVKQERAKSENVILLDNGDLIESNMINLFNEDDIHPMIKTLNLMNYDTWTLGNHEFNFGLDVLNNAISDFEGDTLSANIVKTDGSDYVNPYVIKDVNGVKVAIVGITAPHIKRWEASAPEHFEGLDFLDPLQSVKDVMKELQANDEIDVIVGVFHIGKDGEDYEPAFVDGVIPILEAVPGFDIAVAGHAHDTFGFADQQKYVGDTLIVEPSRSGSYLAKATLELEKDGDDYKVVSKSTDLLSVKGVAADQEILDEMKYVDDKSKAEAYAKIGVATENFLPEQEMKGVPTAQVQDSAVIDLINEVQMFYGGADVSGAALFDTRSDIKKGDVLFKDAALIYKYSNTLQSHKINGKQLKEYMEWSASYYNVFEKGDLNVSFDRNIRAYNYDMFSGVNYEIDVTAEPGNRIKNLTFTDGTPVVDSSELVLAINNYRVGTLQSLGILENPSESLVYDSVLTPTPEMQRLIQKYIVEEKGGVISPNVDNNWDIVNGPTDTVEREALVYLVNNDYVVLPTSEDGRTSNVDGVNQYDKVTVESEADLIGKLNEGTKRTIVAELNNGTITDKGQLYVRVAELLQGKELIVDDKTTVIPATTVTPSKQTKPAVRPVRNIATSYSDIFY